MTTYTTNITASPNQEFTVVAKGDAVLKIREDSTFDLSDMITIDGTGDGEFYPDDMVDLFVQGLNAGIFNSSTGNPADCRAELLGMKTDILEKEKLWHVAVKNMAPGAFRVLYYLTRYLEADHISIKTSNPDPDAPVISAPAELDYPPEPAGMPFSIEGERDRKEPAIGIVFKDEPPKAVVEKAYRSLELWEYIAMCGGYTDELNMPLAPGIPVMSDAYTVQVHIEYFNSDEKAFYGIYNIAKILDSKDVRVDCIELE